MGNFTCTGTGAVSDSGVGTITIGSPLSMLTGDYSLTVLLLGQASQYLMVTGFQFGIPPDAKITGISATISRMGSLLSSISDNSVKIVKNNSAIGTDAKLVGNWPISETVANYGSDSDLWGMAWTPADINGNGFGVAISAVASLAATAKIGEITMTVSYLGSNRYGNQQATFKVGDGISKSEGLN